MLMCTYDTTKLMKYYLEKKKEAFIYQASLERMGFKIALYYF